MEENEDQEGQDEAPMKDKVSQHSKATNKACKSVIMLHWK